MRHITALTIQKRNKNRVNVHLDGEYAFSLAMITAAYLKTGQPLSEERIRELQLEDDFERAKESAMRLISLRPRSTQEIRRRLRDKSFEESTIDQVVDRFTELDLINDEAFARYWIEQRDTFKPRGQRALRQELFQKGISREIVDVVIEEVDDYTAALRAATPKAGRFSQLPEVDFRRKLQGFLQRRGFDYAITRQVTDELWDEFTSQSTGENEWTT